ncbi:hypothetical protein B1759_14275 [Rubrivirga sp. SAORIC476]|uniref:hypothetical protein n=1 Tax=Rubrivirga sp. SAORIC476 TaxID=1961794 RepID=UPI000BA94966|nr:hypothetical protein [Rubrivirga sp. SAORIC476]PAP79486.1 hypothetical protein B1759_14275 [Rubrivirga sp. SAORIC476]
MPTTLPLVSPDLHVLIYEGFEWTGGAYVVRAVDEAGQPFRVSRLLGTDETGVLYIGKAKVFGSRVVHLRKCVLPKFKTSNHAVAYKLDNHDGIRSAFPPECMVVDLYGDQDPRGKEKALLLEYFYAFGESPPFNKSD